jgi:hypothetical protein
MQRSAGRAAAARRRLLAGALAAGAMSALAACQNPLPLPVPTPAATGPARRPQPLAEAEPPGEPAARLDVDFGRTVRLEGVTVEQEVVRAGEYLRVWLHWQATEVSQEDLRALGELIGPNDRVMAKEDDQIGQRRNYLSRWRRGDRHVDEMRIRIAPSTPPGEYGLALSVLRPDNQTRVPITDQPDGTPIWGEDAILAGSIEVARASSQ